MHYCVTLTGELVFGRCCTQLSFGVIVERDRQWPEMAVDTKAKYIMALLSTSPAVAWHSHF